MTSDQILQLAARQHSLVARHQVLGPLLTVDGWKHLRHRPEWVPLSRAVLRHRSSRTTPAQGAMAGVLDAGPGAILTGLSGAALWGLPGFSLTPAEVAIERGGPDAKTDLAVVRHNRSWPQSALTVLDGIPVVRPEALLVELAAVVHPGRLERALDNAWSRRLLTGPSVTRYLDSVGSRGRKGVADLRRLLHDRGKDYVPPASGLEARFIDVLERAGMPAMARQVDAGDDVQWCGRVDFCDRVLPYVIEVQSERYHAALVDRRADAERRARLEAGGWVVGEVTDTDVWHRPGRVIDEVQRCRRLALSGLAA